MSSSLQTQLDNPVWWALSTRQFVFAQGDGSARRYQKQILPFSALAEPTPEAAERLDQLLAPGEVFFLIGAIPENLLPASWQILNELPCMQMVQETPQVQGAKDGQDSSSIKNLQTADPGKYISDKSGEPSLLGPHDKDELYQLIQRVQPGYYLPDTYRLGNYWGIRQDGKLVAVAGERIRMEGLTEISAICTDPAYAGRGYARLLTTHLCGNNHAKGIIPFLHVLETNERAIRLYEYMGFKWRRKISFWKMWKKDN